MSILFINASADRQGATAALATTLLSGQAYDSLYLPDYRIDFYGQTLPKDQFDQIVEKMRQYDTIVIGSPMYWHNLAGSLRVLLDRFYGPVDEGSFSGTRLFFLFQGGAPEPWMLQAGEYTMRRFASLYGFAWQGMATTRQEAAQLAARLKS